MTQGRDEGIAHAIEVIRRHISERHHSTGARAALSAALTELACGAPPGVVTRSELETRIAELEAQVEQLEHRGLGVQLRGHKFTVVVNDVLAEINAAMKKYEAFNSAHHGYAVILEELDELWKEVKAKGKDRSHKTMYGEAKQVAAMAIRFMIDVCGEKAGSAG